MPDKISNTAYAGNSDRKQKNDRIHQNEEIMNLHTIYQRTKGTSTNAATMQRSRFLPRHQTVTEKEKEHER